ncbi:hypothetical protein [Moraxella lacunata]|uniref:hypothetical protein n=1 Tax=Moraxella lacunata TaxID=477 RepID=UPI003EE40854
MRFFSFFIANTKGRHALIFVLSKNRTIYHGSVFICLAVLPNSFCLTVFAWQN